MIYAHTMLSKYELCPKQFQHLYVLKDLPKEPPSQALKDGRDAHQAFEARLKNGTALPEPWKGFEPYCVTLTGHRPLVEVSLAIKADGSPTNFWDDSAWFRGKVDVATLQPKPGEGDPIAAVILDWKTGKKREEPDELEIFGLLIKAAYPLVKQVNGYYIWLKEGKVGALHLLSETEAKLAQLKERTERIEKSVQTDFFPPIQGPLCGWCPVKKCRFNTRRD